MPLLEAMDCHAPITCSNASCFPEIVKDAALFFDPNSIDSMVEAMEKLLNDNALREDLIVKVINEFKTFHGKNVLNSIIQYILVWCNGIINYELYNKGITK